MRYLLDTNILIYYISDKSSLSQNVLSVLENYDSVLCISAETLRELIVAYRNKHLLEKKWKSVESLIDDIENIFYVTVLPLSREHLMTYSRLRINELQDHFDPSDHVIISHALTEKMPLISSDNKFLFYTNQGLELIFNKK